MPYASDAQRRKFHAMLAMGEIKKNVVDEYDKASKGMNLPERIHYREDHKPTVKSGKGHNIYSRAK